MIGSRRSASMLGVRAAFVAAAMQGCGASPPQLDVSSPKVLSVSPTDGATGVPLTTQVTVCFDRAMDPSSVTPGVVVFSRMDGRTARSLSATVSLSFDSTCLTAAPWALLAPSSHYRLDLEKGLLSAQGVEISSKSVQFTASFTTLAPAATASMLIPSDGMLNAPSDLSQVLVAFSAPVSVSDGGPPFTLSPLGTPAELSADGRTASASFPGAASGTEVSLTLSGDLLDASGQTPLTSGKLGFTVGSCAESGPPSLGQGLVLARDRDAILSYAVDRPSLCGASLVASTCPDAGSLPSPAQCQAPYDPCQASLLCLCAVALVDLCPGSSVEVTPASTGFDGQIGTAPSLDFSASPALPGLVLTEINGGSKTGAFVEVQNRGGGSIDLLGLRLADCGLTLGCSSPKKTQPFGSFGGSGSTRLDPDGYALLVDPTFDASLAPPDALLLAPLAHASLLSLSATHVQSLALLSPDSAAVLSSYDGSVQPKTGVSLERIDPTAADPVPGNWARSTASEGTPGACNSVTAGALCDGDGSGAGPP